MGALRIEGSVYLPTGNRNRTAWPSGQRKEVTTYVFQRAKNLGNTGTDRLW